MEGSGAHLENNPTTTSGCLGSVGGASGGHRTPVSWRSFHLLNKYMPSALYSTSKALIHTGFQSLLNVYQMTIKDLLTINKHKI